MQIYPILALDLYDFFFFFLQLLFKPYAINSVQQCEAVRSDAMDCLA